MTVHPESMPSRIWCAALRASTVYPQKNSTASSREQSERKTGSGLLLTGSERDQLSPVG